MADEDLLAALQVAENANTISRPCQVCVALEAMSEAAKSGVLRALSGTIGEKKLARILTDNGYPTWPRAINRHRREAHS